MVHSLSLARRGVLRGALNGVAVAVALPMLDVMLDGNGEAMAATGAPLPKRFGTWFWGCGNIKQRWVPEKVGSDYDVPPDLAPIIPYKKKVNILTGFNVELDGRTNDPHYSGLWGFRAGQTATSHEATPATFDINIADQIGGNTRFRSIELSCNGGARLSYSRRSLSAVNPPESTVAGLYARMFGADFQDPNAADFKPSVELMARKSALSSIAEDRKRLMARLGSADRARLDEYFSSLRQVENQVALQLQKPAALAACAVPPKPRDAPAGTEIDQVQATHKAMAQLLAMALACNQTKVFNVFVSESASSLRKAGTSSTFHQFTHEELVDSKLGYQREVAWFSTKMMEMWGDFLQAMDGIKEGAGTLLDNCLVVAHSDCSLAQTHDVTNLPVMTAGSLGGVIKTNLHVVGNGQPVTRIGLTAQQVMGVPIERWGTRSMETSRTLTDIIT